jgi:SSS family solute:Na+ symporter
LDSSATPYVCLALGTLTVIYTSLGGLRAVIWTDVAQLLILFSGAVLSILFITYYMGGVGAWLPRRWDPNWETPQFGFDPAARVTIASAILSAFVWYVCTAGSDQMAIQRYLATRDKRSAQRMFKISLISDASVACLLAILGLALHAYFRANPQMLPDGETLATGADRLFPQFIVKGLPMGITGLVIAGLLSAAMSSLSSGLNSTCTVITVDWIDRFRKVKLRDSEHVRLAKRVSWLLGTAIVSLSLFAGTVKGNLLEVSNRLVNLFTAPLFVLFFMAMFIPWATTFGTWMAAIASVAMAVAISYFELGGLSFLWIMPMSLVAGVVVGCLASFAPIGKPRPMLKVK